MMRLTATTIRLAAPAFYLHMRVGGHDRIVKETQRPVKISDRTARSDQRREHSTPYTGPLSVPEASVCGRPLAGVHGSRHTRITAEWR